MNIPLTIDGVTNRNTLIMVFNHEQKKVAKHHLLEIDRFSEEFQTKKNDLN